MTTAATTTGQKFTKPKTLEVTWTEWYPTATYTTTASLTLVEDLGRSCKGRKLGRYEVRVGDNLIGHVESAEVTLYRKVGRCSNPSGRAVRWRFSLSAPWSESYRTSGSGYETRDKALSGLALQAHRAKLITV